MTVAWVGFQHMALIFCARFFIHYISEGERERVRETERNLQIELCWWNVTCSKLQECICRPQGESEREQKFSRLKKGRKTCWEK